MAKPSKPSTTPKTTPPKKADGAKTERRQLGAEIPPKKTPKK